MNRSDLVIELRARTDLTAPEAQWLVAEFFSAIADGLAVSGHVELRGFGVFRVQTRQQAGFINPKNQIYYPGLSVKTVKFQGSSLLDVEMGSGD